MQLNANTDSPREAGRSHLAWARKHGPLPPPPTAKRGRTVACAAQCPGAIPCAAAGASPPPADKDPVLLLATVRSVRENMRSSPPAGPVRTPQNRKGPARLRLPLVLIYAPAIVSGAPDGRCGGDQPRLYVPAFTQSCRGVGSRLAAMPKLACSLCARSAPALREEVYPLAVLDARVACAVHDCMGCSSLLCCANDRATSGHGNLVARHQQEARARARTARAI